MRYQEKIYLQSNVECLRNKDILNVNCSSDIDVFTPPSVTLQPQVPSGNTCVSKTIVFSGIPYNNILATAVSACTSASTCLETVTWRVNVSEDGTDVYTGGTGFWTGTTITGNTPPDNITEQALQTAFTNLGYTFSNTGMVFRVSKPYGAQTLNVDLCLDIELSTTGACSATTACSATCVNVGSQVYPIITSATTGVIITQSESDTLTFNTIFSPSTMFNNDYNLKWRYEIYKFDKVTQTFHKPLVEAGGWFDSDSFTGGSKNLEYKTTPLDLEADGDYIMKSYWETDVQTKYRNELGDKWDTSRQDNTGTNGLYRREYDNYFIVNYSASTPFFTLSRTNTSGIDSLKVISFILDGTANTFDLGNNIQGDVIVSLNGVTLAENLDYTLSAITTQGTTPPVNQNLTLQISLLSSSVSGDVITYAYVDSGNYDRLTHDTIQVSTITSGATGGQGSNDVYYNTAKGKYEIYTRMTPDNTNDIFVTINGVTLANGVDYYQSTTNPKRIILEGNIFTGDIINIYYGSFASIRDDIFFNEQYIPWTIGRAPQENNGQFVLEISDNDSFTAITQTATTDYVIGQINYDTNVIFSGSVGTTYYYRVKNTKDYRTMCGDTIRSRAYSEIVPIVVRVNSINSY